MTPWFLLWPTIPEHVCSHPSPSPGLSCPVVTGPVGWQAHSTAYPQVVTLSPTAALVLGSQFGFASSGLLGSEPMLSKLDQTQLFAERVMMKGETSDLQVPQVTESLGTRLPETCDY